MVIRWRSTRACASASRFAMGAYYAIGEETILSFSPELFFERRGAAS
jgi:anthranilate/para-aminobenzoate synthase component I